MQILGPSSQRIKALTDEPNTAAGVDRLEQRAPNEPLASKQHTE